MKSGTDKWDSLRKNINATKWIKPDEFHILTKLA